MAEQIPEGECYKVIQLDAIFSFPCICCSAFLQGIGDDFPAMQSSAKMTVSNIFFISSNSMM